MRLRLEDGRGVLDEVLHDLGVLDQADLKLWMLQLQIRILVLRRRLLLVVDVQGGVGQEERCPEEVRGPDDGQVFGRHPGDGLVFGHPLQVKKKVL